MRPKFDPVKSIVPRPARLPQSVLPLPSAERHYSYFVVDLPDDVTSPDVFTALEGGNQAIIEGVLAERAQLAVLQAEEMSRTWCVPAWWHSVYDDGNTVVVRRISHKTRP